MSMEPLSRKERAIHLLNRFAYGPRPEDLDMLLEQGEKAWLGEQLSSAPEPNRALTAQLKELETLDLTPHECFEYTEVDQENDGSEEARRKARERQNIPRKQLSQALVRRAVEKERQLEEVLCDFWRNHLNVSFTKGNQARILISDYERTVVRRHTLGNFEDMLMASAEHPAMLHYLDNHLSRKPPTEQELRDVERRVRRRTGSRSQGEEAATIAGQKGLNENYAREIMELHTLGVDNYYKQKDVIALAGALTGWTFSGGSRGTHTFEFRKDMHAFGDKRLLGKIFKEDKENPQAQGLAMVQMLARHKGTAAFVSMKLARFFVADVPPPSLVKRLTKAYKKTKGNVPSMIQSLVASEEFWSREHYRAKFKTPYEFVMSAFRALNVEISDFSKVHRALMDMGQPIYHCDDPTGYYDTAESWLDPGVMALRWEFALGLAGGKVKGIEIPPNYYDSLPQEVPRLWQHYLTEYLVPSGAGKRTRNALSTITNQYLAKARVPDSRVLGPELVGLLLGSPEFQQQ